MTVLRTHWNYSFIHGDICLRDGVLLEALANAMAHGPPSNIMHSGLIIVEFEHGEGGLNWSRPLLPVDLHKQSSEGCKYDNGDNPEILAMMDAGLAELLM